MSGILLGADPELFVRDDKGRFRSAHNMIPGTKAEPYKVNGGAVQVDGMALEFNIDPASSEDEFVNNIRTVMGELRKMVPAKYEFVLEPTATFHGNHINAQPDEAKELGCTPDFNAHTMQENPRPNAAANFRTASGHVHIGFTEGADIASEEHMIRCATLGKHLDYFLGVRSLEWDKDTKRRELYGQPGAIRFKPYGVEYRVLSNAWLKKESLVRFVYQQTMACVDDLKAGNRLENYKQVECAIKTGTRRWYIGPNRVIDQVKLAA